MIRKALIIDEPWIGYILQGRKSWEMRSAGTKIRGDIALIRKGSGAVVAVAELTGTIGPLDRQQMLSTRERHQIPPAMINSGAVDKWRHAWKLNNVRRLEYPVPYKHPRGAVIWVNLELQVCGQVQRQLAAAPLAFPAAALPNAAVVAIHPQASPEAESAKDQLVPFARDNTCFSRSLGARGYFQVGAKDEEVKYDKYEDALLALKKMRTARWRRPNSNGNWGIVAAVHWAHPHNRE